MKKLTSTKYKRVLFRVDGFSGLGLGHLIRCLGLADTFNQNKIESIFLTKKYDNQAIKLIKRNNYRVEQLPSKIDVDKEIALTINITKKYKNKLIIIDLINVNTLANLASYRKYINGLKKSGLTLAAIDGGGVECIATKIKLPFNIIIIPYYKAEDGTYKVESNTKLLLGTKYFIINPRLIKYILKRKKIRKTCRNILVSFSSTCVGGLKNRVINSLAKINNIKYLEAINLPAGKFYSLMAWADVAIITSGLRKYEAAALGLPSIVIASNKTHDQIMQEYLESGACRYLGWKDKISQEDISQGIKEVLVDYNLRRNMSRNGKMMIDGRGGERIIKVVKSMLRI